ncbi:MAG TPA: 2-phosphosulfolactate phosphatase, partial [bacterium (Candidatus Stahlbacteria)]|nr:2-phosphosulfolactate phosphatase [Candidatus Stahlbacteria bacterium]
AILCGERQGKIIEGFQLGNSPLEYLPEIIMGKTLIFSTTNGTRAIARTGGAETVLIGAFINLSRIRDAVRTNDELYLLCAAQDGRFALEDFLFCGALAREIQPDDADDATRAAIDLYSSIDDLSQSLKDCDHGRYLASINFTNDIKYAAKIDAVDVVLQYKDGRISKIDN